MKIWRNHSSRKSRKGGVKMTRRHIYFCGCNIYQPNSTIGVSYESCDLWASFNNLVKLLRPLVWPQQPHEKTDGKDRKIIGENFRFVNFWARVACSTSKKFPEHQWSRFDLKGEILFVKVLKKIKGKNLGFVNFWARGACSTSKESSEHLYFRFEIKR